jgi:PKD repeat protein
MKKTILSVVTVFALIVISTLNLSAQASYNMCSAPATVTDSTGTLYDSGGLSGDYLVDEDCTLLVAPSCATTITLSFNTFSTESGYDYMTVYDGSTTSGTQLLYTSGATVPGPLVATSGSMLIIWHSDFTVTSSGWDASWTSVIAPSIPPNAAFTVNDATPPLNAEVQFTDASTGGTTGYYWQFGDGDTAHSQNPSHAYAAPGVYTVTYIPFQCSETDTATMTITVQAAPQITVSPMAGFIDSVACGDSSSHTMTIGNIGGGQLLYSTDGSLVGQIKVLCMTYGVNQFVELPNTIAAINSYFTNYQLTYTGATTAQQLSGQLVGKNVLLVPEQENNINSGIWPGLGPVIQQFLNNGGSVIFCGSSSTLSDNLFNTGVFTGSYASSPTGTLNVINGTHPLTTNLGVTTFAAPSATYSMNFTNSDIVRLVTYNTTEDVVSYRYYGSGKAIFIAFDYHTTNSTASQIIANAIEWGGQNALPTWIHITPSTDTVNAAGSNPVTVTFVANSLPAGTYYANISVNSNDPNNPQVAVPCTLYISGDPIISLSDNCFNYGQVIQHVSVRDTLRINNIGCDTLLITSLTQTLSNSPFTFNSNLPYVLPGAYADLVITYQDNNVGQVFDTIHVNNNDTNMWVCLTANSVPAPQITASSNSIVQPVRACGETAVTTLDITNSGISGAGDLTFNLSSLPSWVSASPTTGTIPQGQSVQIILTFNSQTFAAGNQPTNLTVTSNDPQTPNKIIGINMLVDSNPCISLSVNNNTCNGFSTFTTSTINIPTTYDWNFGDGGTSNVQNPVHPYPYNGNFTATCIACNGAGCDTSSITVQAIITGPAPTQCYPATAAYCCGIGTTKVQIFDMSSNIYINKVSNDAIDGYKDYTCTDTATLLTTIPYNIYIETGQAFPERVRVWLDMNADAYLDSVTELIWDDCATFAHSGTFTLPDYASNVFNTPIRMRIMSDYQDCTNGTGNPTVLPCANDSFGQCEDYSIFLSPILSTHTLEAQTAFTVYPNPFENSTTIDYMLKNSSVVSIEIFNVIGEKVDELVATEMQGAGHHTYTFSDSPPGVYFVKFSVDGKTSTKKIIKM